MTTHAPESVRIPPLMPPLVPALAIEGLHHAFGRTTVLRGVDLQLRVGERLALIGPNGAGKSSLFQLVSGHGAPQRGRIRLNGQRIDGLLPHQVQRLGLARGFQVSSLFGSLSVAENLRCALLAHGVGGAGAASGARRYAFWRRVARLAPVQAEVDAWLQRLDLDARRDMPAGALSHAEQRALELGLAAASGAPVLLLDEPTAGFSRSETARMVGLIRAISAGRSLLMVEHDMAVVFELADRVAVLVEGQVIACDTPAAVRADARVRAAYLGGA